MSDRTDALQSALKKIAADLAARGPVPYVWLPQLNERDQDKASTHVNSMFEKAEEQSWLARASGLSDRPTRPVASTGA
jgi:hypothetical protein